MYKILIQIPSYFVGAKFLLLILIGFKKTNRCWIVITITIAYFPLKVAIFLLFFLHIFLEYTQNSVEQIYHKQELRN